RERREIYSGVRPARERPCRRRSFVFLLGFWSLPFPLHRSVNGCFVGALTPRFSIRGESALELAVEMERLACCSCSTREMEANLDPSSPVLSRGWRLSQFYRRRSSFREEEAQSAPSSPAFGHGGWRLTKLRAAVVESQRLRSQEEEDLRRRLRLFEEEVSGGRGFRWFIGGRDLVQRLNSPTGRQGVAEVRWRGGSVGSEFRRKVVTVESVGRLCEDGATKLRRATRGARMNQILTRVLLCLLPASPEQARRSVCGPWAMFLIWPSAVLFVAYLIFGFCGL
ncbi:LOW QUALITY PROTEIN: hypothetical protein HID58_075701, partial [Brassica napus]